MKTYEVNADGDRHYASHWKASVMRVARVWKRLGYEPKAYLIDGSSDQPVTVTGLAIK